MSQVPSNPIDAFAKGHKAPSTDNSAAAAKSGDKPAEGGIALDTSIDIAVPPKVVFDFWRALENFPRFMSHVIEVRKTGDKTHLWRVKGPLGTEVSWDSRVTDVEPDRRIAWASDKGATVENRGEVRFSPTATGTHLAVRITYAPPAGIVGHAVATLMGMNPRQQMDDDLKRCRSLLEEGVAQKGKETVTGAQVRHDEAQRRSVPPGNKA